MSSEITFVCWKWKSDSYRVTYTAEHANIWAASIERNFKEPHRKICITDDPVGVNFETFPLWGDCSKIANPSGRHLPSCYRRLRIFDAATTAEMDIGEGDIVVSIDLDAVFVRDIKPLFIHRTAKFMGWRGPGSYNPVVYNGSIFQFRAGHMQKLWSDFDQVESPRAAVRSKYFGSDQGWISHKLAGSAPGWVAQDGILSYTSDIGGHGRGVLPPYSRIVFFNGKRKPWESQIQAVSPWIKNHWRL